MPVEAFPLVNELHVSGLDAVLAKAIRRVGLLRREATLEPGAHFLGSEHRSCASPTEPEAVGVLIVADLRIIPEDTAVFAESCALATDCEDVKAQRLR